MYILKISDRNIVVWLRNKVLVYGTYLLFDSGFLVIETIGSRYQEERVPEAHNFKIGTTSYWLQSLMIRIANLCPRKARVFRGL